MALPSGLIDGMWSNGMKMPSETPRVKALLDLVATERLMYACSNQQTPISEIKEFSQERKQELLKHVFCDISQNPKFRSCTGNDGVTGCLTTSTLLYSYGKDRMVLPFELMLFQGHRRGLKIPQDMKIFLPSESSWRRDGGAMFGCYHMVLVSNQRTSMSHEF